MSDRFACGYTGQRIPLQHRVPQRKPSVIGPGPWQLSGGVQAVPPLPHTHSPPTHCSPALQHTPVGPQAGPLGQPPEGAHAELTPASPHVAHASGHACDVHETLPSLQVHELQPSPAANVSPE